MHTYFIAIGMHLEVLAKRMIDTIIKQACVTVENSGAN